MSILITETIISSIFKALLRKDRTLRIFFVIAAVLLVLAIISEAFYINFNQYLILRVIAVTFGVIGGLIIISIGAYQIASEQKEHEVAVQELEVKVREHPQEPQAAWELGRTKLESYLNRNLKQVRWIFFLTLIVMFAGLGIIGYGVYMVFQFPERISPSIVVTVSGIIVEFIATTFLLIYRSTIQQAKEYVTILERINAVGMSVQILESIESNNSDLRDTTRAEIAKGLLSLYGFINSNRISQDKSIQEK